MIKDATGRFCDRTTTWIETQFGPHMLKMLKQCNWHIWAGVEGNHISFAMRGDAYLDDIVGDMKAYEHYAVALIGVQNHAKLIGSSYAKRNPNWDLSRTYDIQITVGIYDVPSVALAKMMC